MLEFDTKRFAAFLEKAPARQPLFEPSEHSPYIQKMIDDLKEKGELDLSAIDWMAFELRHVTPKEYEKQYEHLSNGWLQGIVSLCKKAPPVYQRDRTFF